MKDFQEKRKRKRFFQSGYLTLLLFVLCIVLGRSVYDVYKKDNLARMNAEVSERKSIELEAKKDDLTYQIERLETERGVEEELRTHFQVAKPGEEVVVIIDRGDKASSTASSGVPWYVSVWRGVVSLFELK